ncbi:lytic transglycosylase domain-containing protein [bacterium]|nr:lytic transglycosylase domain-containing protein [bacterium]
MAKWHLMKARRFSCFALFFSIFSTCSAGAAPVPLTDTVELKATLKRAAKNRLDAGGKKDAELLPPEYSILVRARALLKSRNTVATMEEIQKEMLLSRLSSLVKGVEREFEDYFYAFEIKKGIAYTKRHLWKSAYDSFQRGIGGLGPFKWPLYWREEASQQLSILCGRDPKTKDDACLALARRVADGFPKAALETKLLRELPLPDSGAAQDFGGDRLSQAYSERTERDDIAFQAVLEAYLQGKESVFKKELQEFFDELGFELEGFNRTRNYSNDFLLYLMRVASVGNQHMITFKLANELIQRKAPQMQTEEMLDLLFPEVYANEIHAEAAAAGLDPVLVMSLIKQESGFKPGAISSSGALGLMQLMPFTAIDVQQELKLHTLVEPLVNVSIGVRYLKSLMDRYDGNVPYALAAYNAGPHRVARWRKDALPSWTLMDWIESIPFKETRDYVSSILRHRYWYQVQKGQPVSKITELKTLTTVPPVDKN